MALKLAFTAETTTVYPNAYARNEQIVLAQVDLYAMALFLIYADQAAADLAKKQRQGAWVDSNDEHGNAVPDPDRDKPSVQPVGSVQAEITGLEFQTLALAQLQMQGNVLEQAYNAAKLLPSFAGAQDV